MNKRRLLFIFAILASIIGLLFASILVTAYTNYSYICENTGSQKGHREWFFGLETNHWSHESKLEEFMKSKHPDLHQSRWTFYASNGHSLIPAKRTWGDGSPGPIIHLHKTILDQHLESLNDRQRLELYCIFESDNEEAIQNVVDDIHATYSASLPKSPLLEQ